MKTVASGSLLLGLCDRHRAATGGAFDVRLPGRRLDPCAVAKGRSVQKGAELLRAAGARRFCLNAAGDVVTGGPWRVGVRRPEHPGRLRTVVRLTDGAAATSARYERGDHILDGRTGLPSTGLPGLTVTASTLTGADAVATAAFAPGPDGVPWAAGRPRCEVSAVTADRPVPRTGGFPAVGSGQVAA